MYIFVEGDVSLKREFKVFFLRFLGRETPFKMEIVMRGGNFEALELWRKMRNHTDLALLLIDSEDPVKVPAFYSGKIAENELENIFCMVQSMESWYLTDSRALQNYCKQGFEPAKLASIPAAGKLLPGNQLEAIDRKKVAESLHAASRHCPSQRKRFHEKMKIPFCLGVLPYLSLKTIAAHSYHANRLLERLLEITGQP